jgi:hypothetical protein
VTEGGKVFVKEEPEISSNDDGEDTDLDDTDVDQGETVLPVGDRLPGAAGLGEHSSASESIAEVNPDLKYIRKCW